MVRLLTPEDVASLLRISLRTVYEKADRFGGFYPGGVRCLRFRQEVIDGIMAGQNPGGLALQLHSSNSFNNYRKEVSTLFSWIQKIHIPDLQNPCAKIEKMPGSTPEKKIPTRQEFLKILSACNPDERPLIVILAHTLGRIDEILRLTWQDVNFEQGTVTLQTRKNRAGEWKSRRITEGSTDQIGG